MKASLFAHVFSIETRKILSYRVDFWISALASFIIQLAVAYYLWLAVFEARGVERIGRHDLKGLVVYYTLIALFNRIVRGDERAAPVAGDIYDGALTRYLLYPSNYFGFKYAEYLGALLPAFIQLLVFGGAAWLFAGDAFAFDLTAMLAAFVALMVANLLYFLLGLPLQMMAFWADNVWSLQVMLRMISGLLGGALMPVDLMPDWARALVAWLPFRFLFDFPVACLEGRVSAPELVANMGLALAWCTGFALISRLIWRRGALQYTGVGI